MKRALFLMFFVTAFSTMLNAQIFTGKRVILSQFIKLRGDTITHFSKDKTFASPSDYKLPTQLAVKDYIDTRLDSFTIGTFIDTINGQFGSTIYITTGSSGSDYNISSSLDSIRINIPSSSASSRGLLSSADWSLFNGKEAALTFSTGLDRSGNVITNTLATGLGGAQGVYGGTTAGGDLTLNSTTSGTKGAIFLGSSVYDESMNYFGIQEGAPVCQLHVSNTGSADPRGIMSAQYSSDNLGARIHFRKARGTSVSPVVINTGDAIGKLRFSGYDGSAYLQMGSIDVVSTGTVGAGRIPTYMSFSTATDASPSVLTERLKIHSNGQVSISGNAAASTPILYGNGTWFNTGGTSTTTKPYWLIEPSGVPNSNAWDTLGTGIGINAASGFTGRLFDAQVNGVSRFYVSGSGTSVFAGALQIGGSVNLTSGTLTANTINASGTTTVSGANNYFVNSGTFTITSPVYSYLCSKIFQPAASAGTYAGFDFNSTINQTGAASGTTWGLRVRPVLTSAVDFRAIEIESGSIVVSKTITTPGTTGNQTINKLAGRVNIAAAGTTITVTNSLVTANSIVMCELQTNDATAIIKNVVPAAGSFTVNLNAAATAETAVGFFVIN